MVSWIVRDFTQLSIEFYRLHACQLSTVPGWGGEGGGWVTIWLFAPAIVRTKPIQTLIIQECSRTINTRDTAEWNGFHAHTFQTRIFRFFGSHTYSYFLYCCRGTTARDVASSSLSLARSILGSLVFHRGVFRIEFLLKSLYKRENLRSTKSVFMNLSKAESTRVIRVWRHGSVCGYNKDVK